MKNLFYFKIFGCKVNQYRAERLRSSLLASGYNEAQSAEEADISFVFSCSVTKEAQRQSYSMVRKLSKNCGNVKILGCSGEKLFDVDILDIDFKYEKYPTSRLRTRPVVVIQEGCDRFCSFCKVNYLRGRPISRDKKSILEEILFLEKKGYNEVILSGISLGKYQGGLSILLKYLLKNTDSIRFRLGSLNPEDIILDKNFTDSFSDERLCSHIHLSLQSASEKVLFDMRRYYKPEFVKNSMDNIRKIKKNCSFGFDLIAGFPTEREEDFQKTLNFLKAIKPSYLHVFPFSRRYGTLANLMRDRVGDMERKSRALVLRTLGEKLKQNYLKSLVGSEEEVIIEKEKDGFYIGTGRTYTTVIIKNEEHIKIGDMVSVKIIEVLKNKLIGRIKGKII